MKLRSVRAKLFVGVLFTSLAALLVTGAALLGYDLHSMKSNLESELGTQAELIGRACVPALQFDDAKAASGNLALLQAQPLVDAAALYNTKGAIFARYLRDGAVDPGFPQLPDVERTDFSGDAVTLSHRLVANNEILGWIYLRAHYDVYQRVRNYTGILVAVVSFALVISLLLSTLLQRSVTDPIRAVAVVAQQVVEKGDFSPRARKTTDDEIGYLVDAFNRMLGEIGRRAEDLEATNHDLAREVAERKKIEDEVRRLNLELEARVEDRTRRLQETNKELESFSYSISHDLRAPLRGIDGFSQLLERHYGHTLDDEGKRLLSVVRDSARRMGTLIEDLLSFSRLGRKSMAVGPVAMPQLVQECLVELLADAAVKPEIVTGPLPTSRGDRALLKQVWVNLIGNAVKYSSRKPAPRVEISARQDAREQVFTVRDNGAGFDMQYYDKLFGVFQRLHSADEFSGTGVGLAIVQRIVVKHDGRVWAESVLGEGTAFHFSLPLTEIPHE